MQRPAPGGVRPRTSAVAVPLHFRTGSDPVLGDELAAGQGVGQVLLVDHAAREVVRVLVADAAAQLLGAAVARVAQARRRPLGAAGAHLGHGGVDADVGGVRLGRAGQVDGRLGEVDAALGQADELPRPGGGNGHLQGLRVGVADVLGGEHDHAPGDELGVLAGRDHRRHVIEGRVGVGAAHALDEGGGRVVVAVAALVVQQLTLVLGVAGGVLGYRAAGRA